MKIGRLFWGVFLVQTGLLFAFGDNLPVDFGWAVVWRVWPATLILVGLLWLVSNTFLRASIAVVAAILLGTSVYATLNFRWWGSFVDDQPGQHTEQQLSTPFDSTMQEVTLNAGFGAGEFELKGLTDELVSGTTRTSLGRYALESQQSDNHHNVDLNFYGNKSISFRNAKNELAIKLNPNPVWNINIDAGACELECDLSSHKVGTFTLDAGATSLSLKLGDLVPELRVRIDVGASDVRIEIPQGAGCEVTVNSGLTSKHLSDFDKVHDDTYRTPNFDNATSKILIDLDAGLSSIRVERY